MPNLLDDLSKNDADLLPLVKKTDGTEELITALGQKYPPPQAEGPLQTSNPPTSHPTSNPPEVTSHASGEAKKKMSQTKIVSKESVVVRSTKSKTIEPHGRLNTLRSILRYSNCCLVETTLTVK
jgi:hypothetical protein